MTRRLLPLLLLLVACGEPPTPEATPGPTSAATPAPAKTPGAVKVEQLPAPGASPGASPTPRKVKRWLGMHVANMKEPIAGAPADARAMITRSIPGSPAYASGLRKNDVIVEANGQTVKAYQDYIAQARTVEVGQDLAVAVLRDGQRVEATMTMMAKPGDINAWRRKHFTGSDGFDYDLATLRPEGGRVASAAAQGKPKLLYFWATWCGPCRKTGPWVDELHQQAGDKLQVAAVSSEELAKLKPYVARSKSTYPIAHDADGSVKFDYEVNKLPTAVLLDGDGRVVAWDYGTSGIRRVIREARTLLDLPEAG
jgi:thiol-disulfide isomerase/thioredoxin